MIDHEVSVDRLATVTLWTLSVGTLAASAFTPWPVVGYTAIVLAVAAMTATVRHWCVRLAELIRHSGNRDVRAAPGGEVHRLR